MKKGFTLIELLVVVLIIGILAAVALPQYQKAVLKSRAARIWPVLRTLDQAVQAFCLANPTGGPTADGLAVSVPSGFGLTHCSNINNPTYPQSSMAYVYTDGLPEKNVFKAKDGQYLILGMRNGKKFCGSHTDSADVISLCKQLGLTQSVSGQYPCNIPSHNCMTE